MRIIIYKSSSLPDGEPWDKPEIIQSFMKDREMENKIIDLIKNEKENTNKIDDICKNILNKLDSIYSNYYWQVIPLNRNSGGTVFKDQMINIQEQNLEDTNI